MTTQQLQFHFTGKGGEYFRIWIVNVFLSIVTLGVYSAWAKVRSQQYFYRHTTLAGSSFDYHGDPKIILKGRVLAVLLFGGYSLASRFYPSVALLIFIFILLVMPWLLVRSLRFRFHNSSYRGLRFAFHGETRQAYYNFLLFPLLLPFTLGLIWPSVQQRMTRYVRNNSAFGDTFFRFDAGSGSFYRVYFRLLLLWLAGIGLMVAIVAMIAMFMGNVLSNSMEAQQQQMLIGFAGVAGYMILLLFLVPYATARLQNLVWNHTHLGVHGFSANLGARGLFGVMLSNLLLIVITLGLYKPYADIRLLRYRLQHLSLVAEADLDQFMAGLQSRASAGGEEIADMFDFDIAL